jgi:hypothetical protein
MKRVREMLRNFLETAVATLREIFDEAAYARFLSRAGMVSSSESYAEFRRELEETKLRRPKCC